MSDYSNRVDSDLLAIITAKGESFIFDGVTIPCGITRPSAGNEPMEGGAWEEYQGQIFTRRAYFDQAQPAPIAIPVQGDTITVDGVDYTVGKVKATLEAPLVTINFTSPGAPR